MASSSAARSYRYQSQQAQPRRDRRVGIVRGIPQQTVSPSFVRLASILAVVIVLFAALSLVRIELTNATVHRMISSNAIAAEVEQVAADNASLAIQKSVLSSPAAVRERAAALGMVKADPDFVEHLVMAPDVVSYDGAGNLSLARSVANAV